MALINTPDVEEFYSYLRRLYGNTYGPSELVVISGQAPIWQQQLRAWAVLLQLGRDSIDRAFRQAYPALSDELIAEWEQAFRLPNDRARTIAERQARLAAIELTHRGGDFENLREALRTESSLITISGNLRDDVIASGAEDDTVFQAAIHLTLDEYTNPVVRQAVERIFWIMAPARNLGQKSRVEERASATRSLGARHADPEHYLDVDSLIRQTSVAYESPLRPSRMVSYGPGSKLRAHDLNRVQEGMLLSIVEGASGDTTVLPAAGTNAGGVLRWANFGGANGATVTVDDTIDWRNRFLLVRIRHHVTDIRPGAADDDIAGIDELSQSLTLYTGPGTTALGSGYRAGTTASGGNRFVLFADSTTGELMAKVESASNLFGYGLIKATDPFEPALIGLGFDEGFDSGFA